MVAVFTLRGRLGTKLSVTPSGSSPAASISAAIFAPCAAVSGLGRPHASDLAYQQLDRAP